VLDETYYIQGGNGRRREGLFSDSRKKRQEGKELDGTVPRSKYSET